MAQRRVRYAVFAWILVGSISACGDDNGDTGVTGDALRGGQLYDAWWSVIGKSAPTTDHPLWSKRPDKTANTRTGADTWRCKECHGWDYKGTNGRYGSGDHATGIKGILDTTLSAEQIVDLLSDPMDHDYASVLSAGELENLAVFVTDKLLDPAEVVNADGTFKGTAANGMATYTGTCTPCHGADGLNKMPTGSAGAFEEFPGLIANENPWEFTHKARFGQPGTMMPPQADVLTVAKLADLGAYTQTLPQEAP